MKLASFHIYVAYIQSTYSKIPEIMFYFTFALNRRKKTTKDNWRSAPRFKQKDLGEQMKVPILMYYVLVKCTVV